MIKQEFTHRKRYIAPKVMVMETEIEPLLDAGGSMTHEPADGEWDARSTRKPVVYFDELDDTPETSLSIEHDSDIYY